MFSLIFTNDSPSGKLVTVASPSGMPIDWQISSARGRFELPEKILSRESVMEPGALPRPASGERLFCVRQLLLQSLDPFEQVRQSLVQDGEPALEQVGYGGRTVDEGARRDV